MDVTARALEGAARRLRDRRRWGVEAIALAGICGLLAAAAAVVSVQRLALALAAGAAVEALLGVIALAGRRELISELAVEPEAYVIPDVSRYGNRLAAQKERERLARSIRGLLTTPRSCSPLFLVDRVATNARELDALASDLLSPANRVHPISALICLRLLTRGTESPLYNPRLPAEDLGSLLRRIRAGIRST